jgi:hypothetical protein
VDAHGEMPPLCSRYPWRSAPLPASGAATAPRSERAALCSLPPCGGGMGRGVFV